VLAQHDLRRVRKVLDVYSLHHVRKVFVFRHHVELVVPDPAGDVQVARPYARPPAVGNRGLGMQHGPVPLENPQTCLEERLVPGT